MNLTQTSQDVMPMIEIGGVAFFIQNQAEYVPYFIVSIVQIVVGTLGNLLIMGAIMVSRELKKSTTNILILNVAIADLLICLVVNSFLFIGLFKGKKFFLAHPAVCHLVASFSLIVRISSTLSIMLLSFNRYVLICQFKRFETIFSVNKTIFLCLLAWFTAFLLDLPNFYEWGDHIFDNKYMMCMWDRLASRSYTIFVSMFGVIGPTILVMINYLRIFVFTINQQSKSMLSPDRRKSMRITKGLFTSFIIFILSWMPYGIIVLADHENKLPRTVHMYSIMLVHMNSAFNPIIYGMVNPAFKRGYILFLNNLTYSFRRRPEVTVDFSVTRMSISRFIISSFHTI